MRYDLIIVGGGLVGAGLANALKQTNLRMALIDARVPDNNDPRLFALNHDSCQFLKNLGVWPALLPHASPIHQVHVSSQGQFGVVRLNREDVRLDALGYVVPARYIEGELELSLEMPAFAGMTDGSARMTDGSARMTDGSARMTDGSAVIDLFRPAKLKTISQHSDYATLVLEHEGKDVTLESAIVIGADGANSTVRAQMGIPTETVDYQQKAIVTRTSLRRPHRNIAYERFNSHGAIAMLPLPDDECATIWTADNAVAESLMALDDDAFLQALQTEFGYRLGRLQKISKRHVFPLQLVRAENTVQESVLLLGNSAHAMHPIAAQGFNLALYEVAMLVDAITQKLAANEKVTAADLHVVSKQVFAHQKRSIKMSHTLVNLFSDSSLWKKHALSLGMTGLNMIKPVKAKLINTMMGRSGVTPRLLKRTQDDDYFSTTN